MVRGSAWMIGMRWSMRAIGVISTAILARLLTPDDYGVAAMAMILVGFISIFNATGYDLTLIYNRQATRAHYDTAWTLQILQGTAAAIVIALAAPLAAAYFDEPRLPPVIYVLALAVFIGEFTNIGIVDFRRDLQFAREFWFYTIAKLVNFGVIVALGIALRDYWALALGIVSANLVRVALSYMLHPYRPRLSLAETRSLWSFSQWMLLLHVGDYLKETLDTFVVGRFATPGAMGHYSVASQVSAMPTVEIVMPVGRALFPTYVRLADDQPELARAFLRVVATVATISLPLGLGLAAVSGDAVAVLLGSQWDQSAGIMRWLAVAAALTGIAKTSETLVQASGRPRWVATALWVQIAALAVALPVAGYYASIMGIVAARLAVVVATLPVSIVLAARTLDLAPWRVFAPTLRPLAASAIMVAAVWSLPLGGVPLAVERLAISVAVGALVFTLVLLGLWMAAGRPDGPERDILRIGLSRLVGRKTF